MIHLYPDQTLLDFLLPYHHGSPQVITLLTYFEESWENDRIEFIPQLSEETWGNDRIEFIPQPSALSDPLIVQFGLALKTALETDDLNSRLYADSMTHALATHLLFQYSQRKKVFWRLESSLDSYGCLRSGRW